MILRAGLILLLAAGGLVALVELSCLAGEVPTSRPGAAELFTPAPEPELPGVFEEVPSDPLPRVRITR